MLELWGYLHAPGGCGPTVGGVPLTDQFGMPLGMICGDLELTKTSIDAASLFTPGYSCWQLPGARITWDHRSSQLELQRSICGISSIYYRRCGQLLLFATRLPRLLKLSGDNPLEVDTDSLFDLLAWGRILPPNTLYREIHSLMPGQALLFQAESVLKCKARQDWDWVTELARRLQQTPNDKPTNIQQVPDHLFLSIEFDPDLVQQSIYPEAKRTVIAATEAFNALPKNVALNALPSGDIAEGAVAVALGTLKDKRPIVCDLSTSLLQILLKPEIEPNKPSLDFQAKSFSFMARSRLRSKLSIWKKTRAEPLWQTIEAIQRLIPGGTLNAEALFRLLYVLPDRRMRLSELMSDQKREIHFSCAPGDALADAIASTLQGKVPSHIEPNSADVVIANDPLSTGGTGANPYDRTVELFLDRNSFGIDYVARYFRLSPWSGLRYRAHQATPFGAAIEQRLCAILSTQYLFNFNFRSVA